MCMLCIEKIKTTDHYFLKPGLPEPQYPRMIIIYEGFSIPGVQDPIRSHSLGVGGWGTGGGLSKNQSRKHIRLAEK